MLTCLPSCGLPLEPEAIRSGKGLCTKHTLEAMWLQDFKLFFETQYMPGSTLKPYQIQMAEYLQWCEDNNEPVQMVVLKGRRIGSTELCAAYLVWYILRRDHKISCYIYSYDKEASVKYYRDKVYVAINKSPWLQSFVMPDGKKIKLMQESVRFKTDSLIGTSAADDDAGRGFDTDFALMSEAASMSEDFFDAAGMAILSGDNNIIYESTPKEPVGHFYSRTESPLHKQFIFPSFELTEEGMEMLNEGRQDNWKPHHFKAIHSISKRHGFMRPQDIMSDIEGKDSTKIKQEYLAEFTSGVELLYPSNLYERCTNITPSELLEWGLYISEEEMEDDLASIVYEDGLNDAAREVALLDHLGSIMQDMYRWERANEHGFQNNRYPYEFIMGIDWGMRQDMTAVLVFARRKIDGMHILVESRQWSHVEYDDQFDRVVGMFNKWKTTKGLVWTQPDETGGQTQASGALLGRGVGPIRGMNMNLQNKKKAADVLYNMMQQGRMRLFRDQPLKTAILAVDKDVKGKLPGEKRRHLPDLAAAMLCAIHTVELASVINPAPIHLNLESVMFEV